ncbi:MAG: M14 family zinc carboxypeptidase [Ignavibacteria bacterium]
MKNFHIIIFLSILALSPFAQPENIFSQKDTKEVYSQVRIFAKSDADVQRIEDADLHIDHAVRKKDYIDAWLSKEEIDLLKRSGVFYQVLESDWNKYFANLPKMSFSEMQKAISDSKEMFSVSHSIYGTMGGFLRFNEVVAKLDSMRLEYPNLISNKFSIGSSIRGRSIWTVRVSNNPDVTTGRPEAWYHSLIHAREPESMEQIIYYLYWLLENYQIDPIATYILQNRELYFTPILNPDGYLYNDSTNTNGGGLWRKNRRNNGSGIYGVDLNRNYGTYQFWNSINNGSSTSPSSDTYRGTSPFSEPETQAVMNFVNSRNIQAVLGAHTYGNYIIKPWAWQDPVPTPDDAKFNEYLSDMSKENNYTTGTPFQTVGYKTRGSSDDWYYNDSAHSPHHIISMTPESGLTGFWPTQAEIIPLAQGMLFTNQYLAMIAGAYVYPVSTSLNKSVYSPGESGSLKIKFKNKGQLTAQNVKIESISSSYYLNLPITFYNYSSLNSFAGDSANFGFTISPSVPNNSALPVQIKFRQNDSNTVYTETKYILIGNGNLTLSDSAENGFTKWTTNQGWAITTAQSHSPTRAFTDSPSGNYVDNANNSMTLNLPVNISTAPVTYLNFWHKYSTEAGYDFCNVEVSSNNGSTWQQVTSYNGDQTSWVQQNLDITTYANSSSQLKVRFTLKSDAGVVGDGWYIDDIKLLNYNPLTAPVITQLNIKLAPEGLYNSATDKLNLNDTVTITLRNNIPPYGIIESGKTILDSANLTATAGFINAPSGTYYIELKHRNSIETWSKSGGESYIFGGTFNYDFTSSATQAFGNNLKLKSSRFCIYSGDVNQDGIIDGSDTQQIDNDASVFLSGYFSSDVNGDNFVDGTDALITSNNAANFVGKVTP